MEWLHRGCESAMLANHEASLSPRCPSAVRIGAVGLQPTFKKRMSRVLSPAHMKPVV
jgi:hypothetical protein